MRSDSGGVAGGVAIGLGSPAAPARALLFALGVLPEEALEIVRGLGALRSLVRERNLPDPCRAAIAIRVENLRQAGRLLAPPDAAVHVLSPATREQAAKGRSADPKEQMLLAVATKVALGLGENCRFVIDQARCVGLGDDNIVEAIALAAVCALGESNGADGGSEAGGDDA